MGRNGVSDSALVIGRGNPQLDICMAPVLTLQAPVIVAGSATLKGSVTSMQGFPTSNVYFEWGWAPGAFGNTTAVQVAVAPGAFSAVIDTTPVPGGTVYYRFAAEADGKGLSSSDSFLPLASTHPVYWFVRVIPFVFVGIVMLLMLEGVRSGNVWMIVIAAILVIVGVIGTGLIWDLLVAQW